MAKPKLLFICTANINRSRAGELLFKGSDKYEAQSAGVMPHPLGRQVVTQELIDWADRIFVMDEKNDHHLTCLNKMCNTDSKRIDVLDIQDKYDRNDPYLTALLKSKLANLGILV